MWLYSRNESLGRQSRLNEVIRGTLISMTGVLTLRGRDIKSVHNRRRPMRIQWGGHWHASREATPENQPCWHFGLELQLPEWWENKLLVFNLPGLCYSIRQPKQTNGHLTAHVFWLEHLSEIYLSLLLPVPSLVKSIDEWLDRWRWAAWIILDSSHGILKGLPYFVRKKKWSNPHGKLYYLKVGNCM